jgi:SAM-dependent methyltransferase
MLFEATSNEAGRIACAGEVGRPAPSGVAHPAPGAYSAVDNLEVMELAERYNGALTGKIAAGLGADSDVVLDHGAGTGTFARRMTARGYRVQCLEADPSLAARLWREGFACESASARFADGRFSGIYSLNVLEHIADDAAELRELRRLLRPAGKLVLFVPAFGVLFSSMDRKVGHLRRYRRGTLRTKVEQAGFQVLTCSYCDSLGFFASLAYRLLGNRRGDLDPRTIAFYDRWCLPLSLFGDRFMHPVLGKNICLVARRRETAAGARHRTGT